MKAANRQSPKNPIKNVFLGYNNFLNVQKLKTSEFSEKPVVASQWLGYVMFNHKNADIDLFNNS